MCNRYTLIDPDGAFAEIARILGVPLTKPQWVTARYNIGLMQVAPTVVNRGSGPEVLPMNFGYHGSARSRQNGQGKASGPAAKESFPRQDSSHGKYCASELRNQSLFVVPAKLVFPNANHTPILSA
ncbi:MAG: hypothetical protein WC485_11010 [Opitutaceae bacterium]